MEADRLTSQQRIDRLIEKTTGGLNGGDVLTSKTVKGDATPDPLTGGAAPGWFWGLGSGGEGSHERRAAELTVRHEQWQPGRQTKAAPAAIFD